MSELRNLLETLGFADVKSLLQSGNLVFQGARRTGAMLERQLEAQTNERLGVSADYFVRSAAEWELVVARNPFPREAERDPSHLLVMFLKEVPEESAVKALEAGIKGPEIVHADAKELYLVYPAGIGTSKLTSTVIERTLGTRGTGRNWNTVLKLAAMCL
jgi:uncharacterized protein (DUF1697 family)